MKKIKLLALLGVFTVVASAQDMNPNWDSIAKAIWPEFRASPDMIDSCALKLAHDIEINRHSGWPAYCNDYENTSVVVKRVAELKNMISSLDVSPEKLKALANGKIWVGATDEHVILSWGSPKDINRTTTANKVREQWVYDGGYIYVENGIVSGIQN